MSTLFPQKISKLLRNIHNTEPDINIIDNANIYSQFGDHTLNSGNNPMWAKYAHKQAAVLCAILIGEDENSTEVIFTTRAEGMRNHAGQISFPGGRRDAGESALTTALREAKEEIALPENKMIAHGFLDPYYTISRYCVIPVVGIFPQTIKSELIANPDEVADIFTVPLEFLVNINNIKMHSRMWEGIERHYYAIQYKERYIWGATAGMLKNLSVRVYQNLGQSDRK